MHAVIGGSGGMNIEFTADTSWGSHMVPLMATVCATRGAVLEMGVGNWSTPVLHAYCTAAGRRLVSVDEDHAWAERYAGFRICDHEVRGVNYDQFVPWAATLQWSVVFLDQSPGHRRAADAVALRECADYIVVHDYSGAEVRDSFAPILEQWEYGAVAKFSPSTLVLGRVELPQFDRMELIDPWCDNCQARPAIVKSENGRWLCEFCLQDPNDLGGWKARRAPGLAGA